jgi:hypothetical protein
MEKLLLGELGGNAATAHEIAPGMFSFKPAPPTEEEKREQAAADARNEQRPNPPGFDFNMIPDLSLVHRAMIPGVWNRVRMGTFPENWCVLGFDPDSQEQMGAQRGSHTQVVLEAYGHGGLPNIIRHLRADSLQFCGFRVSMTSRDGAPTPPEPEHSDGPVQGGLDPEGLLKDQWFTPGQDRTIVGKYVFVMWVGEEASEFTRKQAAAQLLFFRDYFHHADVELVVAPPPGVPLDGKELQALIAAQLVEGLALKGHATAPEEVELDFTNRDAPKVCTHYDWEIGEGDGDIKDLDALSHALNELETAYADVDEEDRETADAMLETTTANLGLKKGFLDSKVNEARTDTARTDTHAQTSGSAGQIEALVPPPVGSKERPMTPKVKGSAPRIETSLGFSAVTWADTVPARPYRADSREVSPTAQFETGAARRDTLGGTGQVWIPDCCEQWRYFDGIVEQITRLAAAPETLSELVRIGEITDSSHPAYISSCSPESGSNKSYLAYAAIDLKQHTVLGFYGGVTKTVQEAEADESERDNVSHYGLRLQCTAAWGRSQLEIDAAECGGNELRFVNDYRTDIKNYDDPSRQQRGPNAQVCEVWIEGEPMPRACFITTKAIALGKEITIDYSNGFWETELGLQAEEEASAKAEAYRARVATGVQTTEQSGPDGKDRVGSDVALTGVQDAARRSVAQQKQHDAERAAAEACGGGMAADEYEQRWVAEQRAQMKSAIARLKTELGSMQEDFYNTADEMIDLSQETLRLQHEADREATRTKLLEGAGGAKSKLAARLAAKKAAAKAHLANG